MGLHRCVLSFMRIPSNRSLHSTSICCNVLYKSIFRMLSDNISWFWHSQLAWTLHASLPLKVFAQISGRDCFKGEDCNTPGVCLLLSHEIGSHHRSSVKIMISRSRQSMFIKIISICFTDSGLFGLEKCQNLVPIKNLYNETNVNSKVNPITPFLNWFMFL